jgi:hypothetical protein
LPQSSAIITVRVPAIALAWNCPADVVTRIIHLVFK